MPAKRPTAVQLIAIPAVGWLVGIAVMYVVDGRVSNSVTTKDAAFLLVGMLAAVIVVGVLNWFTVGQVVTGFEKAAKAQPPAGNQKSPIPLGFILWIVQASHALMFGILGYAAYYILYLPG